MQALCIAVLEVLPAPFSTCTSSVFALCFAGADKKVEGQKEGASDTWEKLCLHYLQQVRIEKNQPGAQVTNCTSCTKTVFARR